MSKSGIHNIDKKNLRSGDFFNLSGFAPVYTVFLLYIYT